jgi:hypothetical protein
MVKTDETLELARAGVLVSYSSKNEPHLAEFLKFLSPSIRWRKLDVWAGEIQPSLVWRSELEARLNRCRIAVLLVTADYLASEFICNDELPHLLDSWKKGLITLLWVAVEPANIAASPLAGIQSVNNPRFPLSTLSPDDRMRAWVEIVAHIEAVYDGGMTGRPVALGNGGMHSSQARDAPAENKPTRRADALAPPLQNVNATGGFAIGVVHAEVFNANQGTKGS